MKAHVWLKQAEQQLVEVGISTARLDALVLLEDEVGKDRSWLLAHPEYDLQRSETEILSKKCAQRMSHTPLAYVRGKTEFYGREFIINEHVLEPRPESETMIDLLKGLDLPARAVIADIGTGSGALAITAALELPEAQVYGTDIDPNCLVVARKNNELRKTAVQFYEGDLCAALPPKARPDVLLCNLPYVPADFHINTAAMHEPKLAIFGGKDGLDLYRTLFKQLEEATHRPEFILTESLPPQHDALSEIARQHHYSIADSNDFIQILIVVS